MNMSVPKDTASSDSHWSPRTGVPGKPLEVKAAQVSQRGDSTALR